MKLDIFLFENLMYAFLIVLFDEVVINADKDRKIKK